MVMRLVSEERPVRGRVVPDEPAHRGPADGHAVGSDGAAVARAQHPSDFAKEVTLVSDRLNRHQRSSASPHEE